VLVGQRPDRRIQGLNRPHEPQGCRSLKRQVSRERQNCTRSAILRKNEVWLQFRPAVEPVRMRLFCLPHAGGGATAFRTWHTGLPSGVQVCPILLPGRETRRSEPSYTDLDSLADALARQLEPWLDLPFAVFGHSMGSLLAFEWVRRIQRSGQPMPRWLFLSGRRAPHVAADPNPLHALPDAEFVGELTRLYEGLPQEILSDPELMEVFLPVLRADIAVVESYRFQQGEPLDCPMTVFAGAKDMSVAFDELLAWKPQTRRRFAVQMLPGGHFYPPEPLLQTISATLAGLLG
jgi:medium-chain acyl-[acyl-carrier-protein] hydrolase